MKKWIEKMVTPLLCTFIQKGKVGKLCLVSNFIIVSSVVLMFSNPTSVCIASEFTNESHSDIEAEHEMEHNHVAVFVGGMSPVGNSKVTSLALGLNYERRLNETFGLEVLADFTVGSHERAALFMTGVTYRPFREYGLRLMTGPGFEIAEHDGHPLKVSFVYGVGAAWEFHLGKVSIVPAMHADFMGDSKTNITFGISIGTGF